ncbi:MAG: F0F1 ATP synthase subunit B [Puniceicoccales bacterium]|jgi:F-type H+-transporting ATPase subunit b|nr:F0F1 ATP synthase subunit B [Puniceicoccales bacterium]
MDSGGFVIFLDKFGINVPLLCIQMANFVLVAYLLYRFGFRNILRVVEERNKQISSGLEYAKQMKTELGNIEATRSEIISEANSQANGIVSSAKNFAAEEADRQRAESKKIAEDMVAKARVDIANERKIMFSGLKGDVRELVVEAARCVLQHELSDSEKVHYGQYAAEVLTKMV